MKKKKIDGRYSNIHNSTLVSGSVLLARDAIEQCLIQKHQYATVRRKEFKKIRRENARNAINTL